MGTAATGDHLGLLREAIARNAPMVLSLPTAGQLRHHKTRFLADAGDGFWVAAVSDEPGLLEGLIGSQQPAGVSFRSGEFKVIFATPIQHIQPDFEISGAVNGDEAAVAALLLRFPTEVRAVQRRKSFRVGIVPGSTDLKVKVWTMPEQASLRDKPAASRELLCEPRDISVGGIGLTIRTTGSKTPPLATGDRMRVQLTLRETVALLEGRLRYPPRAVKDSSFRAGVQFRTLDDSREDRLAASQLNKIVNEMQRELIRRKKLGLATPTA